MCFEPVSATALAASASGTGLAGATAVTTASGALAGSGSSALLGSVAASGGGYLAAPALASGWALPAWMTSPSMSTVLGVAGFGMSAMSSMYQANIMKANMAQQAELYAYNAKVAENNALMAEHASELEADTFDRRMRALMSSQNVAAAKSGVAINQDSPLKIATDTAAEAAQERRAILYQGQVEAAAYRANAAGQSNASANARRNASTVDTGRNIAILSNAAKTGYSLLRNA